MQLLKSKYILPTCAALALLFALTGCRHSQAISSPIPVQPANMTTSADAPAQKPGEHVAHHGGCLNAIVTCENGHAEIKLVGDKLECWFVGGGPNTGESVPIGDRSIILKVRPVGGSIARMLVLAAKPLALAEETAGHCSYFEGRAAWLKGLHAFTADGMLQHYNDKAQPIHIEYPKGYDPD